METAECRTAASPAATTYDGVISYSHAADDLLAPRLQAGLRRFAKPWWKRRAVHGVISCPIDTLEAQARARNR